MQPVLIRTPAVPRDFLSRSSLPRHLNRFKESPLSSHPLKASVSHSSAFPSAVAHQQHLSASVSSGPILSESESESDPSSRESNDPSRWDAVYDNDRRPLCEHEPMALVPLEDLLTWLAEQQRRIDGEIGDRLEESDGGPSRKELRRELDWLLEDAVAGWVEGGVGLEIKRRKKVMIVEGEGGEEGEGNEGGNEGEWMRYLKRSDWREICLMGGTIHRKKNNSCSTSTSSSSSNSSSSTTSTNSHFKRSRSSNQSPSPLVALRLPFPSLRLLWSARVSLRVPSQYLVGGAHWRDLLMAVRPGVLIPRPETELLVELAIAGMERAEEMGRRERRDALGEREGLDAREVWDGREVWADLGTGSGAIAVALAREILNRRERGGRGAVKQQCGERGGEGGGGGEGGEEGGRVGEELVVVAVDASAVACEVAEMNVKRYGLQAHVHVARGDWFAPLQSMRMHGQLHGIVSNPPYIPCHLLPSLQPEVRCHEPSMALDGDAYEEDADAGEGRAVAGAASSAAGTPSASGGDANADGTACLRHICQNASIFLRPFGFLALETHGWGQAEIIADVLANQRSPDGKPLYCDVQVAKDWYGVTRFVTAHRSDASW
ncbi:hypothetical protein CLOM_g9842 [Closterium sp. NIES-68]|nr:hypothetical protein CLOM_g9842 [Closterium sp. NIES-68]GJP65531.1 hypothetical protein CLOP_g22411 [Closterium sp. NIES-67]